MPNMFWALLCPSSRALDYMCVITVYGVQCLVDGCQRSGAEQQAVCPVPRKRDVAQRATSLFLDAQPAAMNLTPDNQLPSTANHRR